jgi:hypothetical protein
VGSSGELAEVTACSFSEMVKNPVGELINAPHDRRVVCVRQEANLHSDPS